MWTTPQTRLWETYIYTKVFYTYTFVLTLHHSTIATVTVSPFNIVTVVQTGYLSGTMTQWIIRRNYWWINVHFIINCIQKIILKMFQLTISVLLLIELRIETFYKSGPDIWQKNAIWHLSKLFILHQVFKRCRRALFYHVWRHFFNFLDHVCMVSTFTEAVLKCFEKCQMTEF